MRPRADAFGPRALLFLLGFVGAIAFGEGAARAADCSGILSACIDDDTLWPHAGPARFVAVGSAETMRPSQLGFGLVATYLWRPIVLHSSSPGITAGGSDQAAVSDQGNVTFLWSFGVSRRLELDLAVPLTVGQGGTGLAPLSGGAGLKDTAVRDLRFGFAYAIVEHPRPDATGSSSEPSADGDGLGLAARLEWAAPVGDTGQFAGEGSGVWIPSVTADYRLQRFFAGAEAGARVRPTTAFLNSRVGTQILAAIGLGYDILPRELLSVTLEGWALPTLAEQQDVAVLGSRYIGTPNGQHITPAEWQFGVRSAPLLGGDLSLQLAGGTGIPLGGEMPPTAPRFRMALAIRWAPRFGSSGAGTAGTRSMGP